MFQKYPELFTQSRFRTRPGQFHSHSSASVPLIFQSHQMMTIILEHSLNKNSCVGPNDNDVRIFYNSFSSRLALQNANFFCLTLIIRETAARQGIRFLFISKSVEHRERPKKRLCTKSVNT